MWFLCVSMINMPLVMSRRDEGYYIREFGFYSNLIKLSIEGRNHLVEPTRKIEIKIRIGFV